MTSPTRPASWPNSTRAATLPVGRDGANVRPAEDLLADPEEEDEADELDANVLDGVYLAGERFNRMVSRLIVS